VPLDITVQEIQVCLQSLIKFVKRFKLRRDTTNEYFDSQTVLLHFTSSQLPEAVKIGYLNFGVRAFVPKATRCYKCNRFGHVAKNCRGKDKCSKCSGDHSSQHCTSATTQCPNCNGEYRLVICNAPNIVGNQNFSELKLHPRFPMPRLADYTVNRQLLSIHKPHLLSAQENFHHCLLSQKETLWHIDRFQLQNPVQFMSQQIPWSAEILLQTSRSATHCYS